jgi:transposase-like protein
MAHRRKFSAEFKAQVVLDLLSGAKSAGPLEERISGEGSLALSARSDAEPGARADRRTGAHRGSPHHAVGDRQKSLSSLELAAEQKRVVMQMLAQ